MANVNMDGILNQISHLEQEGGNINPAIGLEQLQKISQEIIVALNATTSFSETATLSSLVSRMDRLGAQLGTKISNTVMRMQVIMRIEV